ncbi:MAG: SpoIIE family protein phosphatase [Bacteroidota bacterium]
MEAAAELLAQVEKELGNYQAAYEYQVLFKQMADSLFNEQQTKELTRLEMNYEFEQEKDSIHFANQAKQALLEKDIEKRKITQTATTTGLGLLGLLALVLFLFFQSKQRSNKLLTAKSQALEQANEEVKTTNEELQTANEEIKITNEKLQTANEEITSVNDTLELTLHTVQHQRDEILSSINYAQRIQSSILPRPEYLQSLLPEHFILFKPRDLVSGDFYWLTQTEERPVYEEMLTKKGMQKVLKEVVAEKIILTAIDCTGHGVPGAFMSMVGNTLLNDIVKEKKICKAHQILTQLHQDVRQALQQRQTGNKDGMDMALVSIDRENQKMEFAGAKNPLIYIQNNELKVIKGDIMGIGGLQREMERVFTPHLIDISVPTTFYLFSDGYQDQFGGREKENS